MTFRTRTAPKPTRRRARRDDNRRTIYMTLSFTLAIVAALSLMGGVFVAGYYADHGASIAAVNGEVISKDAVRDRASLNLAIYARQIADYTTLRNQGKITTDEYTTLTNTIQSNESLSTIYSSSLTQLIDESEIRQYAAKNNIAVTDQMVTDQVRTDSTIDEMRHVKIIGVTPEPTPPSSAVTSTDITNALTKIQGYLNEVKGGKAWDDVATEANSASTGTSVGDIGLVTKSSLQVDPDIADAIFALAKPNDMTTIFKGTDGTYRFATVSSIVPAYVDADWQNSIGTASNAGLYQAYARAEATQKAVQTAIEAKYISGATVQRQVLEIAVAPGYGQPGNGDEVKISMIVFAPGHSESNAANVPTTDSSWTDAKARADAAVAKLRADPSQFAKMAADTTVNDDQYWNSSGGSVPWIPADLFNAQTTAGSTGLGLTNVAQFVFAPGLATGAILDPIQEPSQGYVVVLYQGRRAAPDQRIADDLLQINSGVDFATVAKQNSESADASTGGDLGWVSPYMLTADQQAAIFQTPVGRVSNIVNGNGYYLYKIIDQQTRTPDAAQQAKLKKVVFPRWLSELQANSLVWQDTAAVTALAPATPS
ncbi:MAG: peptidylprolyl isomerase [Candidatus Limnocylindrales bacterium]|jgi:parvulin-like peptidyl-prolyl isomerase